MAGKVVGCGVRDHRGEGWGPRHDDRAGTARISEGVAASPGRVSCEIERRTAAAHELGEPAKRGEPAKEGQNQGQASLEPNLSRSTWDINLGQASVGRQGGVEDRHPRNLAQTTNACPRFPPISHPCKCVSPFSQLVLVGWFTDACPCLSRLPPFWWLALMRSIGPSPPNCLLPRSEHRLRTVAKPVPSRQRSDAICRMSFVDDSAKLR